MSVAKLSRHPPSKLILQMQEFETSPYKTGIPDLLSAHAHMISLNYKMNV